MPQQVPTIEEVEAVVQPLIKNYTELLHQVEILTAVALNTKWISREETESLLECSAGTLRSNAEKWNIRYKKGKRKIEYYLPSVIKRMEAKKMLSGAIEKKIKKMFNQDEVGH